MSRMRLSPVSLRRTLRFLAMVLLSSSTGPSRKVQAQGSAASSTPSVASQTITGQTVNAVTGTPIARVLVQCGTAAMLTDYEGRFQCPPEGDTVSITATKPGYFTSEDPGESGAVVLHNLPETPVRLRLFPEAILSGSLLAADNEPLPGIQVQAKRSVYDEKGHHWIRTGISRTDAHGQFRLAVAPGQYRLQTLYSGPNSLRTKAVLPRTVPEESSSTGLDTIHAGSGETLYFDLHPVLASVVNVTARLEPDVGPDLRITARGSDGGEIALHAAATTVAGEVRMEVPSGSFQLEARKQGPEGMQQAATRLTVGDHDFSGVVLRFATVGIIPIDLQVDSSAASANMTPSVAELGLSLESTRPGSENQGDDSARPVMRRSQPDTFNPSPGEYRLRARSGGAWFVRAATYGASDLLRQTLVLPAGSGTTPIHLVVSNQTASLSGTVRANSQIGTAWIYVVSSSPSATPITIVHADADGAYRCTALAPGSYRVVAFEHRHMVNFEDPETLVAFSNELRSVALNPGDKGTLNLELSPFPESR